MHAEDAVVPVYRSGAEALDRASPTSMSPAVARSTDTRREVVDPKFQLDPVDPSTTTPGLVKANPAPT
jgi:hypothetical protein